MAIYSNLSKLGRVKLPSNAEYALIDVDGRSMLAPNFSTSASYDEGDHVIYQDNLYRFKVDHAAGAWDSTHVDAVTVDGEIQRLEGLIAGGVHYRGKTSTVLYEGCTTKPITISGTSYTQEQGDMVIMDLEAVKQDYAANTAYSVNTYIKNGGIYYIVTSAITAGENTSIDAIRDKLNVVQQDPEFLWDGSLWNVIGAISDGLGDLAFKDTASGTYIKPDGTGTVTIKNYTETDKYLARTTIVGTDGTMNASEVTGGTTKNQWKADATNPTVVYGTADVDAEVTYGTANPDTPVTGVAQVDSQKTFTKTWAEVSGVSNGGAITTSVNGDCLTFAAASTDTVYGVKDATGVSITPAVASTSKLTPAKAADSSRVISNLVADGSLTGSYIITPRTPAKVAASATTVATGAVTDSADGASVVTKVTEGTETANVTVATTTDTVTVQ